jgi:hypothetical protein
VPTTAAQRALSRRSISPAPPSPSYGRAPTCATKPSHCLVRSMHVP